MSKRQVGRIEIHFFLFLFISILLIFPINSLLTKDIFEMFDLSLMIWVWYHVELTESTICQRKNHYSE